MIGHETSSPATGPLLRLPGGRPQVGTPEEGAERLLEVAAAGGLQLAQARNLELIHSGDEHLDRLVAECGRAEAEICMEMYQLRRDPVGRRVATALAAAAGRGVSVRLLVDPVGSARIGDWLPVLRRHGVDVRWYCPWRPWNDPLRRTHRKLAVFDGATATVGGINMAAEFSERVTGALAWRDVGLWVQGPVAAVLRRQFEGAWAGPGGGPAGPMVEARRGADGLVALAGGRDGRSGHGAAYIALADAARRELLLATPYFIPDRAFRQALARAAARGVRVVVVVPRLCDIAWFKHAGRRLYGSLLAAGVEIWERSDRMVHAKVGVVDGVVAAVGSANLNRRSFRGNAETLLLTSSPRAVAEIHRLIAVEAGAAAEPLSPLRWPAHPDRRRWAELAAAPVALVF
ncbi:MAG TPA: phosphatidylserine/phosphatidylglycerophosphate/cardiolipin synthase family protein [Methylomirabilota bacterium]|nr:phosphatidylserine/phosphatidylglycerophosphate/cardiolipin synthase family protein [Methylomirabilota bacterium]